MQSETKQCQNCKNDFTIEADDFAFYEKIKVPPPTFCPECRMQRRLAWRNEKNLYNAKCDMCDKSIITIYPSNHKGKIYCNKCWHSDNWDPISYGKEYDFNRPFFEQFSELIEDVPKLALQISNSVDTNYANAITHSKNCYLCFSTANSEDSLYSVRLIKSKNIANSYLVSESDGCNNCINCNKSSGLGFCENVVNSFDCNFCFDMRGCSNCFLCTSKRQSQYYYENTKMEKDDYFNTIKNINTGSYSSLMDLKKKYKDIKIKSIHKYAEMQNNVNCTGDMITNSKDSKNCFFGTEVENCRNCLFIENSKDCMDVCYGCCNEDLMYEVSSCGVNCSNVSFSKDTWPEVRDSQYLYSCRDNVNNCFGCVSLRNKKYCIFNKQYSKDEYLSLVEKIKESMNDIPYFDKNGNAYKYGEFFPIELSPYPYVDTTAMDYFPLSQESIVKSGFRTIIKQERGYNIDIKSQDLEDDINNTDISICNNIIGCMHEGTCDENCTEAFKITKDEFLRCKNFNLPLPRLCPNCRIYENFNELPKPKLYHRSCMNKGCPNEFETSYAPDRPEIVYCESCYQKEVV